jgi:putative membrane protein
VSEASEAGRAGGRVESSRARWAIAGLTLVVFLAVAIALRPNPSHGTPPTTPSLLAWVNVALNAGSGVFLAFGYAFVRSRKIAWHRASMLTAFALSSTFLITYLLHHHQVGSVPFRGPGWLRPFYFAILIPHVLLAAGIVPLALLTVSRAWTGKLVAHRRIARYTLPLWFFVSVSGVLVFTLLYYPP